MPNDYFRRGNGLITIIKLNEMTNKVQKSISKKSGSVRNWQNRKYRVFERDGWMCKYCPTQWKIYKHFPIEIFWMIDSKHRPTVDHVVPLCKGGSNKIENLVTACVVCNGKKGNKIIN